MRVPLSWLNEYVTLPGDPAELAERLTLAGLEAASMQVFGKPVPAGMKVKLLEGGLVWPADQIVVARVLKIEKHPDADKLKLVTLDYGSREPKIVITGAPNIAPGESGMKVVLGLRGTRYYYTNKEGKRDLFTLEPKALRGIMNDAMCMSNFELGIADDHDGIIILDENDAEVGTPIQQVLVEIVLDLDVLPNMARCLGLLGIAREVSALCGGSVVEPRTLEKAASNSQRSEVGLRIENTKGCARYMAAVIRNVNVGQSPRWLRSRLQYVGMRSINNIVDVTNYVMMEYGQPLHAFDYDKLVARAGDKSPVIIVRNARVGEVLKTLDGVDRELAPTQLVIADEAGPIALAGVMGGADTEVGADTKTILLESANFDFVSVRQTARQWNLFSEASTRFSRGIHPEMVDHAARRACWLITDIAQGTLTSMVDEYPVGSEPRSVQLQRSEIVRLLGTSIADEEVVRVLSALQFTLEPIDGGWQVQIPPTRLDIQAGAADLIEELARVCGYDRMPGRMLALELPAQTNNRSLLLEEVIRDRFADWGLHECITYSLSSIEVESRLLTSAAVSPGASDFVSLINPGSPERAVLRKSLLPGLLGVAKYNLRNGEPGVALFEIGPVFVPQQGKLPDEPRRIAIVLAGTKVDAAWDDPAGAIHPRHDFYDLKGVIEGLLISFRIPQVTYQLAAEVPYLHPGRSARIQIGDKQVGVLGELHPKTSMAFEVTDPLAYVAELDLDLLIQFVPDRYPYQPISAFPPILRDVAIVVESTVPADAVLSEIRVTGGDMLESSRLFDVYRGDSIPAGTKSLAYALTYRLPDRQLTEKEVDKLHQKIEARLKTVFKAQIRGKVGA